MLIRAHSLLHLYFQDEERALHLYPTSFFESCHPIEEWAFAFIPKLENF